MIYGIMMAFGLLAYIIIDKTFGSIYTQEEWDDASD